MSDLTALSEDELTDLRLAKLGVVADVRAELVAIRDEFARRDTLEKAAGLTDEQLEAALASRRVQAISGVGAIPSAEAVPGVG